MKHDFEICVFQRFDVNLYTIWILIWI